MNTKLKPCPFCGRIPKICISDEEGNLRDEKYKENPYSGLTYHLEHNIEDNEDCPIAHHVGETLGAWYYDTEEYAIEAWNTRSVCNG